MHASFPQEQLVVEVTLLPAITYSPERSLLSASLLAPGINRHMRTIILDACVQFDFVHHIPCCDINIDVFTDTYVNDV